MYKDEIVEDIAPPTIVGRADLPLEWRVPRDSILDNVIDQIHKGVSTRNYINLMCEHMTIVSQIEPKTVQDALCDDNWIYAMQDELNQFPRNDVLFLIPRTSEMNVIGTKWVFGNKMVGKGIIVRSKARLLAKGYNQEQGIDYDETYAPVARLEAMRLLLAYACLCAFKLFQMDAKSAFLNGFINEEVYMSQPLSFEDHKLPGHVYKLRKALLDCSKHLDDSMKG